MLLSINCYSQISFEKGYYINNEGQKIDCLIKNSDWKNNPIDFDYKLFETGEKKTIGINAVKEFGIYNISKYLRKKVKIDRSTIEIDELSNDKKPIFNEEQLFLKTLVEGKANLYLYEDGKLRRYFYNIENSKIEQLVYKEYLTPYNKIGKNNRYKQQLWNDLRCPNSKKSTIENIAYQKNGLVNLFVKYNECNNEEFTNYEKIQKKDLFNLNIRPGINSSSLSIQNGSVSSLSANFDSELSFRLGIEVELILPFNKNKWAIQIEPTYQYYKSESVVASRSFKVDYKSIELAVGVRHYFFLNTDSKIFINGSFIFDYSNNSVIDINPGADLEIKTLANFAFGVGYKHNNKYSFELRYNTNREVLNNYVFWKSDYKALSLIFGYSFF